MAITDDDRGESRRTQARRQVRRAGDRSADLADTLMRLPASAIAKLELEEDLAEALTRARATTSLVARRREQRTVAGALRRVDLDDLEQRLASVRERGVADQRQFQLAETWRGRLVEEGAAGITALCDAMPAATALPLGELVAAARRERATGKPPGAARALFRAIVPLFARAPAPTADGEGDDEGDDDA